MLTMLDSDHTKEIGESVTFSCGISASPAVTSYFWTFVPSSGVGVNITFLGTLGRYTVTYTTNLYTLTLTGLQSSDAGTYKCTVVNLVGVSSKTGSLATTGGEVLYIIINELIVRLQFSQIALYLIYILQISIPLTLVITFEAEEVEL